MSRNVTALLIFVVLSACDPNKTEAEQEAWYEGFAEGYESGAAEAAEAVENYQALLVRVEAMEAQLGEIQPVVDDADKLLDYVSIDEDDQNGPAVKFTGANVYVQSGSGSTDDGGTLTGLGNLIIGYDEAREESADPSTVCTSGYIDEYVNNLPTDTLAKDVRTGSHNLVIGQYHNWSSSGGLLAGRCNEVRGESGSVAGGAGNIADGWITSVPGGLHNYTTGATSVASGGVLGWADGYAATTTGGLVNSALGDHSVAIGGHGNTASNSYSVASGGAYNFATGLGSTVSGGNGNTADGTYTSVAGGASNQATGDSASVVAGYQNRALGNYSVVAGGQSNTASGEYGALSGGFNNGVTANSPWGWVGGGTGNEAMDDLAAVVGGYNNKGSYELCVMLGGRDGFCTATESVDP